jgi:purine nucleoside permease
LREVRSRYLGFPAAKAPPVVLRGDEVSGTTFWHGALLNRRAADWLAYWTGGRGRFVMTAMEETGTLQALSFLARGGRGSTWGAYWCCALAATIRYHRLG